MKRLIVAAVLLLPCPLAHADPGGQIPMPGLCDYPFVGISGMAQPGVGQVGWYGCRGMQEAQGQYWIQGLAYYSSSGNASSSTFGINLSAGGGGGLTGYFCLDDPYHPTVFTPAADPEPPSAWKNPNFKPTKCQPLGSGEPIKVPGFTPPTVPNQFPTGAVTNPADGNPSQTQNDPRG